MNNLSVEKIISLATTFGITLSQKCSKEELELYKIFFQTISSSIQSILSCRK